MDKDVRNVVDDFNGCGGGRSLVFYNINTLTKVHILYEDITISFSSAPLQSECFPLRAHACRNNSPCAQAPHLKFNLFTHRAYLGCLLQVRHKYQVRVGLPFICVARAREYSAQRRNLLCARAFRNSSCIVQLYCTSSYTLQQSRGRDRVRRSIEAARRRLSAERKRT